MHLNVISKIFVAFFLLAICFSCIPGAKAFEGGTGTEEDPFQIATCVQLQDIDDNLTAHYQLVANVDCEDDTSEGGALWNGGDGFSPIGDDVSEDSFQGTLDGQGYTISNLFINRTDESGGLFDYIDGANAEIRDLGIEDANISVDEGGILGGLIEESLIINVYTTGILTAGNVGGGIAGSTNSLSQIQESYSSANIESGSTAGGMVAFSEGTIENSYATGSVSGDTIAGGLVAIASGTIEKSYSVGLVEGGSFEGGLIGLDSGITVTDSFWDTQTSGQASSDGGTGKLTSEMKDIDTFTDILTDGLDEAWDFDTIWGLDVDINNGYPYLQGIESGDSPAPSPTPSSSQSSGSYQNTASSPGCSYQAPVGMPDLFQINTSRHSAEVFFAPVNGDTSEYAIIYGFSPTNLIFGTQFEQGSSPGVISHKIMHLLPSTEYFFQVIAYNHCASSYWSLPIKAKTTSSQGLTTVFYK